MQVFLLLLLGYILYRFVVGFVLPIVKTTRTMKKQFEQMRQQQAPFQSSNFSENENYQSPSPSQEENHHQRTTSGRKGAKEDYIDFEEVPSSKL